jgi:hypothetical protein
VPPNKRMQLTRRGWRRVGASWSARNIVNEGAVVRASQLIRGVRRTGARQGWPRTRRRTLPLGRPVDRLMGSFTATPLDVRAFRSGRPASPPAVGKARKARPGYSSFALRAVGGSRSRTEVGDRACRSNAAVVRSASAERSAMARSRVLRSSASPEAEWSSISAVRRRAIEPSLRGLALRRRTRG